MSIQILYQQLAIARNKKEYDKSIQILLSIKSQCKEKLELSKICGWLSEEYSHIHDYEQAEFYGRTSIYIKNELYLSQKKIKAMSFSLFGDNPIYCETMILNAEIADSIYPDWQLRVYHDDSIPNHVIKRLNDFSVQMINVNTLNIDKIPGTFWRFFALEDESIDVVIFRDADSLLSRREKVLVDDWLSSDQPFHIIRDWYSHTDLILAGLWGARSGLLSDIRKMISSYIDKNKFLHPTHADQEFLAEVIWPKIHRHCKHHSNIFRDILGSSWPEKNPDEGDENKRLGSWQSSIYDINAPKNNYAIIILDKDNKQICDYIIENDNRFELPRSYRHKIDNKEFKLVISPITISKLTKF